MNNKELESKLGVITSSLLNEKGYISMVDVFLKLNYLSESDYIAWRNKRVPYLEKCIKINLSKVSLIVKIVQKNSRNGKLKESYTAYKSWGKGVKKSR